MEPTIKTRKCNDRGGIYSAPIFLNKLNKLCTEHNKFDAFITNILTTIFFRPTIVYETCKYAKKYSCLSNVGPEKPLNNLFISI